MQSGCVQELADSPTGHDCLWCQRTIEPEDTKARLYAPGMYVCGPVCAEEADDAAHDHDLDDAMASLDEGDARAFLSDADYEELWGGEE